jgi:hypothetical protein
LVLVPEEGAGLSYGGMGGLTGRVDRRLARHEVPLLRPEWLMALPRGEAVVQLRGEVWKLRVPLLEPPPSTTLAHWGLSWAFGCLPSRPPRPPGGWPRPWKPVRRWACPAAWQWRSFSPKVGDSPMPFASTRAQDRCCCRPHMLPGCRPSLPPCPARRIWIWGSCR